MKQSHFTVRCECLKLVAEGGKSFGKQLLTFEEQISVNSTIFLSSLSLNSLVNQLPEANLILLRHLFGVLHHIEQNSGVNQMNAFNLALCIAPNMLWLPSPTGPEEESRSTKKVIIFHGLGSVTVLAEWHPGFILSPVHLCLCWRGNLATPSIQGGKGSGVALPDELPAWSGKHRKDGAADVRCCHFSWVQSHPAK